MKKIFITSLLICSASASVNAQTITFNGLGTDSQNPVTVDGYEFTYSNMNGWAIGNTAGLSNQVGNGTDFITARDTQDRNSLIRMTLNGSGVFSLSSFDGADGLFNIGGRTIEVTGFLSGGGTVVDTFTTVANTFTSYTLSSAFTNLVAVEYYNFGSQGDGFALDNIAVSAVPIPAAAWLFGSGIIGLLGMRKNKAKFTAIAA